MNKPRFPVFLKSSNWGALRITGIFLLVGILWILLSDRLAQRIAPDPSTLTTISIYKGWGSMIVTALLLYWLIQRHTQEIRADEEKLRLVTDALPALISYIDANRIYRFSNRAYEDWFGSRADGKKLEDFLGQAVYQTIAGYVNEALNGRMVHYQAELPYRNRPRFTDVTYVPDRGADGSVKGYFALVQDITERRQAEQEVRRWADAFEHCAHGIAVGDPSSNRIAACNSAFAALHRSRIEDIVGSSILRLFAPSDHAHVRESVTRSDQIGHAQFEANMIRRDGSTFPAQVDMVSVRGDDGDLLYRVTTAQDITQRKETAEEIRQLNEKLEERVIERTGQLHAANRELESFSYSISHDLRAPLRAINGYTRILLEDYAASLEAEGQRVCQVIVGETQRMGKLIDDLLSFSRLSRKEIQPARVDMQALALSVFGELTSEPARERIDFKIGKLPAASGDPALFHQVWINLLSNALKFTSKRERAVIEVGSKRSEQEVVYYVRDNGAGFDIQYVDKMFGVFQRLHSEAEFEGTGVGLAIVERIVQRHSGRVWAEGEVGKGATLYFSLPRERDSQG